MARTPPPSCRHRRRMIRLWPPADLVVGIVVSAAAEAQDRPHGTPLVSLRERLAAGGFAVTAEISPPRGAGTASITRTAALLRDWVDAANVTHNQGLSVR